MPGIDGTDDNRIRETEQVEKIEPERCQDPEAFDKALEKRAEQLDSQVDKSDNMSKLEDHLAETRSPKELLEERKQFEDSGEKFKDACFGEHSDWPDEKRTEEIEKAKDQWESNHKMEHIYDKALERLGYDPAANGEGTSETKQGGGDEGTTGKETEQTGLKKTLEDLGGHKVEEQKPLPPNPDDVGGTQHEREQKAEGIQTPVDENTRQSSYPEAIGAEDSKDQISQQALLQEIQNRRGR